MSRLPIRWQFTLWYGATLGLLLFGFSLLFYFAIRHQLLNETDRGLQEELRELTNEIDLAKDFPELLEQTRRRFSEHGVYHFQMAAPGGGVLFQSETLRGQPLIDVAGVDDPHSQRFATGTVEGLGHCRLIASMVAGPKGPYAVRAVTSMKPFEQAVSRLLSVLWLSGPVALVCGIAAGYTLARRVLSPVERIVEVANRITATDLLQRVEVLNPGDELGRLAMTLNALIDRLQKAIEEMRRFTADAAHELRTPLAVLRSGIDVTLRSPRTAENYRLALESAGDEADRLTRLADQLLYLSRQDAGMAQIDRDEVRIDALIQDVVEHLAPRADESAIELRAECPVPLTVRGDDVALSRAFYNVLENAIKYTPRGGRVVIRGRPWGSNSIRIEVEDNGAGIPPEHLAHVFKRFYRVEQSRNREHGGSGLGLAIAQSAITAHGGTIAIESVFGRGTVVRIELPCTTPVKSQESARPVELVTPFVPQH